MKITKRIHSGYAELESTHRQGLPIKQKFGKYQYIYSEKGRKISLVLLKDYFHNGEDIWEMCYSKKNLFEYIVRFKTQKEAEKWIKETLKK